MSPSYLQILNKYPPLFSENVIKNWEIKKETKSIEIICRSTQTSKELKDFFLRSNLPIKMKAEIDFYSQKV